MCIINKFAVQIPLNFISNKHFGRNPNIDASKIYLSIYEKENILLGIKFRLI